VIIPYRKPADGSELQRPTGHPGHRRRQEIVGRERGIITDTLGLLLIDLLSHPTLTKTGSTPD
jgi:hypothetical protein